MKKHMVDYSSIRFGDLVLKTKLSQNDDFCTTYIDLETKIVLLYRHLAKVWQLFNKQLLKPSAATTQQTTMCYLRAKQILQKLY